VSGSIPELVGDARVDRGRNDALDWLSSGQDLWQCVRPMARIDRALDAVSGWSDRRAGEKLLGGSPDTDSEAVADLRRLTEERDRLRSVLAQRYDELLDAAFPVTRDLLEGIVEDLLFSDPERLRDVSDRKIRRTKKRLPQFLVTAPDVNRQAHFDFGWPHNREGSAKSFQYEYPYAKVQAIARAWLQRQLPDARLAGAGDSTTTGLGVWMGGGSFLAGLVGSMILDGLLDMRTTARSTPAPPQVPIVGALAECRDEYMELVPALAAIEAQLPDARRRAGATARQTAADQRASDTETRQNARRRVWDDAG